MLVQGANRVQYQDDGLIGFLHLNYSDVILQPNNKKVSMWQEKLWTP